MKDKQIMGCFRMNDAYLTEEQLIYMDNNGADAIYLIDDEQSSNEERTIKTAYWR